MNKPYCVKRWLWTNWLGATACVTIILLIIPKESLEAQRFSELSQKAKAPSLGGGLGWINTAGPIDIEDLRGKVVLLDFWTYCCINCMHMLPVLRQLEEKYPNELVVIGVHSAKFFTERESENIRQAVMRYRIRHPVVNDAKLVIWKRYAVTAWPTFQLIDPEGYKVIGFRGESSFKVLDRAISRQVRLHRKKGTLDETPLHFDLEEYRSELAPLRFPGKVLADSESSRLYIADSGHNRIVVSSLVGRVLDIIGSGSQGKSDGSYQKASFNDPQGLALDGNTLYVADNENHLIRQVNLARKTVETLAGTGRQGSRISHSGRALRRTALSNPWDLVLVGRKLYIAVAGPHQLAVLDLARRNIQLYSGSGREDILDGPLRQAAHAQPSGIATDGKVLYVVDSEGSAVRIVSLGSKGTVRTLVGASGLPNAASLFSFGDIDEIGSRVRLQHPLGITFHRGKLIIADTYNHKIKVVDPRTRTCRTFLGDGQVGRDDKLPRFYEPAGVSTAADQLYIADTNNHLIRVADLQTRQVRTLQFAGLAPPVAPSVGVPTLPNAQKIEIPMQQIRLGMNVILHVAIDLPAGFKLNPSAPMGYRLEATHKDEVVDRSEMGKYQRIKQPQVRFEVPVPLTRRTGSDQLKLSLVYYICRDGIEGICKVQGIEWTVPIVISLQGKTNRISLSNRMLP